jgi:hypothetical protein
MGRDHGWSVTGRSQVHPPLPVRSSSVRAPPFCTIPKTGMSEPPLATMPQFFKCQWCCGMLRSSRLEGDTNSPTHAAFGTVRSPTKRDPVRRLCSTGSSSGVQNYCTYSPSGFHAGVPPPDALCSPAPWSCPTSPWVTCSMEKGKGCI